MGHKYTSIYRHKNFAPKCFDKRRKVCYPINRKGATDRQPAQKYIDYKKVIAKFARLVGRLLFCLFNQCNDQGHDDSKNHQDDGYTSRILREEFPYLKTKMPTLWTNSYFVSTVGGAPLEVIKQYIENQKTSQRQKDKPG